MALRTKYREFTEARDYVRKLGLESVRDWYRYTKSGKKPVDIPTSPIPIYGEKWKGYTDWLDNQPINNRYKKIISFNEAREFSKKLGLGTRKDWVKYVSSGKLPSDIAHQPHVTYKKEWIGWTDWLGSSVLGSKYGRYRDFKDAKEFVCSLKLRGNSDWLKYCVSGKKPKDIPSKPKLVYKKEWKNWSDWTGTDSKKTRFKNLRPIEEAKRFVRSLGFQSTVEWKEYCKSGKKPKDIPSTPDLVYKNEWKDWFDWLGHKSPIAGPKKTRSFDEAREFVRSLHLKNSPMWKEYCKSGKKPVDIPSNPNTVYKEWKGVGDWLGTFKIAHQHKKFKTFQEAKDFVHNLSLENSEEWFAYCKSGKKPDDIPSNPGRKYEKEWIDYYDWIGKEDPTWSTRKVKNLLKGLIKSGIIYQWDDAVLYSFLLRKGLLNLNNRHSSFFKNLLASVKTEEGKQALEDYAFSTYEVPPDLSQTGSSISEEIMELESEITTASSEELSEIVQDTDPLDYGKIQSVENILRQTDFLESINVDEEAMKFYVNYSINQLWKNAFANEAETITKIKQEVRNGNKYHDEVIETFLSDYENTKKLSIPKTYSFPNSPLLMQRYVAYKIKQNHHYGNFSGTGAGKTLSAVLASRVIDSKFTLIVCPNEVVNYWKKHILEIFPDSKIITRKDAFFVKYDKNQYQYAILNYDKFNQPDSTNMILNLENEKIDFIVLDEIHFSKIRDKNVSIRRHNLDGLMTSIRNKNKNVKVLGISATPVVNNLQEGRSLLELITGKIFDDVATRPTIPNAVTLYEKLSNISVREMPNYPIVLNTNIIDVEQKRPGNITIKQLKSNPLTIEQTLTEARLPEIIKMIEGQTIIYTEYVEKIIQKISEAVRNAGYSFALHTGTDHSGLERFLAKKIQVLIASRPISTGIDGLQKICNRLIINTLPWTNAQYQQLLGRLVRRGQIEDVVNVYIIKASIAGYPYDQLKLDRIKFKKTLADCAVDGTLPEKNLITPGQATAEAVRWLERLERNEISSIARRDLNVKLSPVEIEKRIRTYGDFEKLNHQINIEKSETTHLRLLNNPEEWLEYHRQYRESRKDWTVIPYEEWIRRIKVLSPRLQIGDFGCGESKIMEEIGERVHSFDHVAISNQVTPCDIRNVPLEEGSLDVVIFSLSLMGKNWADYISEARRCLATNGYLFISETTQSLKGRLATLRDILQDQGFEIYQDNVLSHFTFIEARKV